MGECLVLHGSQDCLWEIWDGPHRPGAACERWRQHWGISTILYNAHSYCIDEQKGSRGDGARQNLCLPDLVAWHGMLWRLAKG